MKIIQRFDSQVFASIVSFAAVALRNFAVGWELVAFFPNNSLLAVSSDAHLYGGIQMVVSFILHIAGEMINKGEVKCTKH